MADVCQRVGMRGTACEALLAGSDVGVRRNGAPTITTTQASHVVSFCPSRLGLAKNTIQHASRHPYCCSFLSLSPFRAWERVWEPLRVPSAEPRRCYTLGTHDGPAAGAT